VIGFSSGGPNRVQHPEITGEVYAIYILEEYQGKGIGRRLLAESVQRLRALDHAGMLIWVLDENPGRKFYESCGGVPVEQREIVIGGAALAETGYGWKSLDTFEQ
jgi:GNAT superfamily N-acetyltransferase